MLLANRRANLPRRCANHCGRLASKSILTIRATRPVNRVLETTRDRAIVLRRHKQYGINIHDTLCEPARGGRGVGIVIVIVQWQYSVADFSELQLVLGRKFDECVCEFAVDRFFGKTANDVPHLELSHAASVE